MPSAVAADVSMVKVDVALVPERVTDVGLRMQVTPLTADEQVSATTLLNPFTGAMVTVEVAEKPGATVAGDVAEAEIWKSGVGPDSTVNVSAAMRERLPDTPFAMTV